MIAAGKIAPEEFVTITSGQREVVFQHLNEEADVVERFKDLASAKVRKLALIDSASIPRLFWKRSEVDW